MTPASASQTGLHLWAGGLLLSGLVLAALLAAWLAPGDPLKPDLSHRLAPPSKTYLLGTDQLGRCVLSRVLFGARTSLGGALIASGISLLLGIGAGLLAALGGRCLELFFTALIDMALALPGFILALVFAGLLGASFKSLLIGLIMAGWPWWARLVRGLTLSAREKEFVLAGRMAGLKGPRLMLRYILPQLRAPVLAAAALKSGWIILAFAGLSYLGLGPAPPTPEWGRMLQEATLYMTRAPWLMLAPGAAVTLTVLALNLLGEGLEQGGG